MRRAAAVAALAAASCFPTPAPLAGKPCDLAHPCPGDLVCVDSVCSVAAPPGTDAGQPPDAGAPPADAGGGMNDAGPVDGGNPGTDAGPADAGMVDAGPIDNVLMDGDFELGQFDSTWIARNAFDQLTIQGTRVRSGSYAGQLNRQLPGTAVLDTRLGMVNAQGNGLYCAWAWVTADAPTVPFLQLVRTPFTGPKVYSGNVASSTAALDGSSAWVLLTTSLVRSSNDFDLAVEIQAPLDAGSLFVDDAAVWSPSSGTCP